MTTTATFIGHGSPMNTIESNKWTEAWRDLGLTIGKPRGILAISAHWYVNATAVTSMERPKVIHDFYGFPQELFDFDYPAPGSPDLARQVAEIAKPEVVSLDDSTWGIDHGTWSVLAHMYPEADVPIVQLAIDARKPIEYHIDLGSKLAPLLDDDILVLASGNVVHNLRQIQWSAEDKGFKWAWDFDGDVASTVANHPEELRQIKDHESYRIAVPTPDHFLPLAYIAGIASEKGLQFEKVIEGCTLGSLSMTSYKLGN